ncbi:nickel-responsive transcriptional regulator NikR [bacterium]|nr:nickel-responsive transcriptional regulator NikR [bacterium]
MEKIVRFGVSMEKGLLKSFDTYIKREKYKNRSEAIRDLIRKELVSEEWEEGKEVAGCIVLVYNHHKRELVEKIMDIQHNFHRFVISTQHVHMDKENCLEIIAVKGSVEKIKSLYNSLKSLKGVKYSSISKATTGKKLR